MGGNSRTATPPVVGDPPSVAFLLNADLAQKRMVTPEKSAPELTFSTITSRSGTARPTSRSPLSAYLQFEDGSSKEIEGRQSYMQLLLAKLKSFYTSGY